MIRGLSALTALLSRALSIDLPACVPSRRTEKKTYLSIYIRRQRARRRPRAVSANSANRSTTIGEAHHIAQARADTGGVPGSGSYPEFSESLKGGSELRRDNLARTRETGEDKATDCDRMSWSPASANVRPSAILSGSPRGGGYIRAHAVCGKRVIQCSPDASRTRARALMGFEKSHQPADFRDMYARARVVHRNPDTIGHGTHRLRGRAYL